MNGTMKEQLFVLSLLAKAKNKIGVVKKSSLSM